MFEMTFSGEDHCDAKLVAFLDGILVADGSARLHDGFHAVLGGQGHAVIEREERIGSQNETGLASGLLRVNGNACPGGFLLGQSGGCLLQGKLGGAHTVHLAGSHSVDHSGLADGDGVGLDMLDNPPGKIQIDNLPLRSAQPRSQSAKRSPVRL